MGPKEGRTHTAPLLCRAQWFLKSLGILGQGGQLECRGWFCKALALADVLGLASHIQAAGEIRGALDIPRVVCKCGCSRVPTAGEFMPRRCLKVCPSGSSVSHPVSSRF